MNKRSASIAAAGLVLTLIIGGLAVAVGLTGPDVSSAEPRVEQRSQREPIVRTVRRTVTVHKKAKATPGQVVRTLAPVPVTSSDPSGSDDATHEGDDGDSYEDVSSNDESSGHEDDGNEDAGHVEDDGDDD